MIDELMGIQLLCALVAGKTMSQGRDTVIDAHARLDFGSGTR